MWPFFSHAGECRPEKVRLSIVASVLSDSGCRRDNNEDSVKLVESTERDGRKDKGTLLVVADGMGGHAAGEVASRMAVEEITRIYRLSRETPEKALSGGFKAANHLILSHAAADKEMAGMGTTCTALALVECRAYSCHIGDSRIYLVRSCEIYQMTEDHSEVMKMVRAGLISLEQARRHDERNVLLQVLGTQAHPSFDIWPEPLPVNPGDRFVLCTDGLHDLVEPDEMRSRVLELTPDAACRSLVELARERGGYDNITVAVAAVETGVSGRGPNLRATRVVEASR